MDRERHMSKHDRKNYRLSDAGGFTLLEVLFAMAIASIGFLSLALMQGAATQGNVIGDRVTQATFLAQQQIELAKNASYDLVDMDAFPEGTVLSDTTEADLDETGAPGGKFNRETVIKSYSDAARQVSVTVSWQQAGWNSQLATQSITLTTTTRGGGN
jgi:prepilin-type N-terminal cleavage/methylation domain-containing protein